MENSICKMAQRLRETTKSTVETTCTENNLYRLYLDHGNMEILIYPNGVIERRAGSGKTKIIHIDQDILESNPEKIIARIQAITGHAQKIPARSTVAARIDKKVALDFQNEHHLQVALPGKYRYGLYYRGELVTVAVFSGGRKMRDKPDEYRSFELLRFCHKTNTITVGGLSKLIKAFRKDFKPGDIMTYVDRDWTQDSSLKHIGFRVEKTTEPHYFIVEGNARKPIKGIPDDESFPPGTYLKKNSGSIKLVLDCTES